MTKYLTLRLTDGRRVTIQRLSCYGRVDFAYHLGQCYELLEGYRDTPLVDLYCQNDQFKYHCDQCLTLNGLPPDKLSDTQLVGLLFSSSEAPYGVLNQFNYDLDKATAQAKAPSKPDTKGSLLGKLWKSLGDLQLALRVVQELPTDVLEDALYEMKPDTDKNKDKARATLERLQKGSKGNGL